MIAGIYRNIDVAAYHADCCPAPSLSQSIAKVLIDRSPLHAFTAHPKLNPPAPDDADDEKYDKSKAIGDAAHALMIGRGKDLAIGKFDSWRTKEAKAFKLAAIEAGKTPIIDRHFVDADAIVRAAQTQLSVHEEDDCFKRGAGEVALIWQEDGLWFRCLVDWLHDDLLTVEDFKTTAMSVAPHVLGLRAADAGWDIQAAMVERGLNALDPDNAGRRRYRFVAQEQEPPYALSVMVMSEAWLTMGRKKLAHAAGIWRACMTNGIWYGYPLKAITPEYPGWKETQWLNREMEAEEERTREEPMLTSMAGG
jgi:PDDEXK-like domain of unknown function (DUF3799)